MSFTVTHDEPLASHTTFGIPSVAEHFVHVESLVDLEGACAYAREHNYPVTVIAGGSNLVCAPIVRGLVMQIGIKGCVIDGTRMRVGAGESLLETVYAANAAGLKGLETLAGIPGTIGGAIVGNAGAYGTEIGSRVVEVVVYDGSEHRILAHDECTFAYRDSLLKSRRDLVVCSVVLELEPGDANQLVAESDLIVAMREKKYPPGLRCPGSFFKNIIADTVSAEARAAVGEAHIAHGKIAAGYLIEAVEGRGVCTGGACVADYHGNLLINTGTASYADVQDLAELLRSRVREHFGIVLEEEIRYIC